MADQGSPSKKIDIVNLLSNSEAENPVRPAPAPPTGNLANIPAVALPRAVLASLQPKAPPPKEVKEQLPSGPPNIPLEEQNKLQREHRTREAHKKN